MLHRILFGLGVGILLTIPFLNRLREYHGGSGRGSNLVDALWTLVISFYTLARLAFVLLLLLAIYNAVVTKAQTSAPRE